MLAAFASTSVRYDPHPHPRTDLDIRLDASDDASDDSGDYDIDVDDDEDYDDEDDAQDALRDARAFPAHHPAPPAIVRHNLQPAPPPTRYPAGPAVPETRVEDLFEDVALAYAEMAAWLWFARFVLAFLSHLNDA